MVKIGLVAAVAAVLLVATIGVLAFRGKADAATQTPTTPVATPESSQVRLEVLIAAGNAKTTAFIDGREIAVGSEVRLPRDAVDHTLRARAPGFREHTESLRLDKDQRISVTLEADPTIAVAAPPAVHTPPPFAGHRGGGPVYVPPKGATPPPPPSAPTQPATPPTPPPQPTSPSTPKRPDRPIIEVLK